jgi:hypothetical protein
LPFAGCLRFTQFELTRNRRRGGYLIARWYGLEDGERYEAFAARLQAETGCLVADRRNGRIVELGQGGGGLVRIAERGREWPKTNSLGHDS